MKNFYLIKIGDKKILHPINKAAHSMAIPSTASVERNPSA
jgi:hypothetical protein